MFSRPKTYQQIALVKRSQGTELSWIRLSNILPNKDNFPKMETLLPLTFQQKLVVSKCIYSGIRALQWFFCLSLVLRDVIMFICDSSFLVLKKSHCSQTPLAAVESGQLSQHSSCFSECSQLNHKDKQNDFQSYSNDCILYLIIWKWTCKAWMRFNLFWLHYFLFLCFRCSISCLIVWRGIIEALL